MASEVTTTQYLTQQNQEQPYLGSASDQTNVYAVEQMETGNTRCYTSRTFQRYPTSYTRAEDLPRFDVAATSILPTNNDLTQAASAPPVPAVATQEDDLFNLFNDNSKPHKVSTEQLPTGHHNQSSQLALTDGTPWDPVLPSPLCQIPINTW